MKTSVTLWFSRFGRFAAAGLLFPVWLALHAGSGSDGDGPIPPSTHPTLVLVAPTNGAVLPAGAIKLDALARDPIGGPITVVDFLADGVVVATSDLSGQIFPAIVGLTVEHTATWANPPPGVHVIVAQASKVRGSLTIRSEHAEIRIDRPAGQAPTLVWDAPPDGLQVVAGTPVDFAVTGTDPLGVIPEVGFFVDGKPVGTAAAPHGAVNGDAVKYTFTWTPTIQVTRKLSARAVTSDHVILEVAGPTITVVAPGAAPTVRVAVLNGEVVENDAAGRLSFRLDRDGPLTGALTVSYLLTGKATFGVDYVPAVTPGRAAATAGDSGHTFRQTATFPAGAASVVVDFAPVSDTREEGDESVVLVLVAPSGLHGLEPAYKVGDPSSGSAVIHDFVVPPPAPPAISIVATTPETSEPSPTVKTPPGVLTLVRDGPTNRPVKVYFKVGGTARNGRDYVFIDGDATIPAGVTRRDIRVRAFADRLAEGDETVVLTLRTNHGYTLKDPTTATVVIHNGPGPAHATLVLTAPAPGAHYTNPVELVVSADVVDPKGYVPRVEFFGDGQSIGVSQLVFIQAPAPGTRLSHSVVWTNPPAGHHELKARAVTADGVALQSEGVAIVVFDAVVPPPVVQHPADVNPADNILAEDEVTAYAAAWLAGATFPTGPVPVPVGYATRAGFLWRNGGAYKYDPSAGPLPLAWVSKLAAASTAATDPTAQDVVSIAVAEVPQVVPTNTPFAVTIRLVPLDGVKAQAVEEYVGPGAVVTEISDGGVFDATAGVIRWGVYFDDTGRKVSATVTVTEPEGRTLSGLASFDGADVKVPQNPPPPPLPPGAAAADARIAAVAPLDSGGVELLVVDETPGTETAIEVSTDLVNWERIEQTQAVSGTSVHVDSDANENFVRFYRAVPVAH